MIFWKARKEEFSRKRQDLPLEISSNVRTAVTGLLVTLMSLIFTFPLNVFKSAKSNMENIGEYFLEPTLMKQALSISWPGIEVKPCMILDVRLTS